jgi:hypothetical protein
MKTNALTVCLLSCNAVWICRAEYGGSVFLRNEYTRRYNSEDQHRHLHRRENLKSHIHSTSTLYFKTYLNIILPYTPNFPSGLFHLGFVEQNEFALISPIRCTLSGHLISLDVVTLIFGVKYEVLIKQSSLSCCCFSSRRLSYVLLGLFFFFFSNCFIPLGRGTMFLRIW